jgi:hypothetical protein
MPNSLEFLEAAAMGLATLEINKDTRYLYLVTLDTKRFLLNYSFTILLFLLPTMRAPQNGRFTLLSDVEWTVKFNIKYKE